MNVILILMFVLLLIPVYMSYRNNKVYNFCMEISQLCYEYNMRRIHESNYDETDAYDWFANKYSYKQYFWSFKSLKLENWFTEEEITKINK